MPPQTATKYEFGDFALFPEERFLLLFNRQLPLPGIDFAILSYLVQHAGAFISKKELIEAVWGTNVEVADSTLSHHMAKIRKVIGCDARIPKFIKTVYNKDGYRFIGKVQTGETDSDRVQAITLLRTSGPISTIYRVTTHLFAPVFLGEDSYEKLSLQKLRNDWVEFKEYKTESSRLCIGPSGFGVWHLTQIHKVAHLSEIASWRKHTYNEILHRKHSIKARTKELLKLVDHTSPLPSKLGKIGYVFSACVVDGVSLKREETKQNMLKALASLSLLEANITDAVDIEKRETLLLSGVIEPRDLVEFGQAGIDTGFAGWDGVSYIHASSNGHSIAESLVEFEIAVQSLWWACNCLIETRLSNQAESEKIVRNLTLAVKQHYAQIRTIPATESPLQRSMVEAILKTSRIQQMVESAVDGN